MLKFKILDTLIKNTFRVFKGETYKGINHYAKQYHSGGDDYNPPDNTNTLAATINNNDCETVVFLYSDNTARISSKGEKRLYSTNTEGKEIKASIHLKNDGNIEITSNSEITINAKTINAKADTINLDGDCNLGGNGGSAVLLETTIIQDSLGKPCTITNPSTKTKAI